jgi:hypothetical protein
LRNGVGRLRHAPVTSVANPFPRAGACGQPPRVRKTRRAGCDQTCPTGFQSVCRTGRNNAGQSSPC